MKIGVISDTHIPIFSRNLPEKVFIYFKDCDLILHAGDILEMSVIEELRAITETKAVCGNMDGCEVKQKLPEKIVFNAAGKKIGLVHGKGSALNLVETVKGMFKQKVDIIVFGHSHTPCAETIGGTLFFNPGSASGGICCGSGTVGIIEILESEINTEILEVK